MSTQHRHQKTKIIATIGPACDDESILRDMIVEGVNVARLNLSHGDFQQQAERIARVRRAADAVDANLAVMVDTRGREIRTGKLEGGVVQLAPGQEFSLYSDKRVGNADGVSISHATLHEHVNLHDRVLLDDGLISLTVIGVSLNAIHCRVENGGTLHDRKGVNLPDNANIFDSIDSDVEGDLEFVAAHEAEYVAASFIRDAADIERLRNKLADLGADTPIIAKIENRAGVDNLDEIIAVADGTMVARGDLGVELDLAQGPMIQKRIIRSTVTNGKPTATQMLDSPRRKCSIQWSVTHGRHARKSVTWQTRYSTVPQRSCSRAKRLRASTRSNPYAQLCASHGKRKRVCANSATCKKSCRTLRISSPKPWHRRPSRWPITSTPAPSSRSPRLALRPG